MSIKLFAVLMVLMIVNQLMGTAYGTWSEGFDLTKLLAGLYKIAILCIGYGAIAFAAYFASDYVSEVEYLSGILIEPIVKYFAKIVESLKNMINEKTVTDDIKDEDDEK